MSILFINGSPNKNGNTAALAAELTARADKEAAEECRKAEAKLQAAAEYIVREVIKA